MRHRVGDSLLSVVVADPSRAQREEVRALLQAEPGVHVIATTGHRADAAQLLCELQPDAAVIEVGLLSACEHPLHGWGAVPRDVRLVAVGLGEDPWLASTLTAAGFAAYLPAGRLASELLGAVRGPRDTAAARFARQAAPSLAGTTVPARFARSPAGSSSGLAGSAPR